MAPTARSPRWLAALAASALAALPAAAERAPEPDPPHVERPAGGGSATPLAPRGGMTEWVLHESADGLHPDADEQQMVWLMNRARQDPSAEGLWLATSTDPAITGGRDFFGVDLGDLQSGFDSLAPQPPAAFDRRLYDASLAHSLDMIALDQQTHNGQIQDVQDAGFDFTSLSVSIFAFSDSALNAHAALNIDWGNTANGIQSPPGHRLAIMGSYDNVGLALVPEASPATQVGPLVFSGAYAIADTGTANHFHRFLVGTVWQDADGDGMYDPGEGFPGVTVTPDHGPFFAVTSPGGGYALPVTASGSYQVTFSGGGVPTTQLGADFGADSELLDLAVPVPEPAAALQLLLGGAVLLMRRRRSSR